jgi:hypothetical protein
MPHPFKSGAKSTSRAKFKALTGKNGIGDGDTDGSELQPASKRMADLKVMGADTMPRVDKRARGGRTGSKININILSVPHGSQPGSAPPPQLPAGPMGAAAAPMPGSLPFTAPGGGAPPPGAPPMRKRGGSVKMTAGSESGLGRLQKARAAKRRG